LASRRTLDACIGLLHNPRSIIGRHAVPGQPTHSRARHGGIVISPPLSILRGADEAPLDPLRGRTTAILGYGNQGRAHALNLRDSRVEVIIGLRSGSASADVARRDGFEPVELAEAASLADLVLMALPDEVQGEVFARAVTRNLRPAATVGFMHGLAVHAGLIHAPMGTGIVLVAPKGPGTTLRERFLRGLGIPCLFAVHQESADGHAEALGLAWACGIGCARAAIIRTTFAAETETDLFGEQAVICGGLTGLMLAAFETLVRAGYPPELAYIECCHEVKQVADLVYERGPAGMMQAISNTAEFGAYHAAARIVDDHVRCVLTGLLGDIRSGSFARRIASDVSAGFPWFQSQRQDLINHPIEVAGRAVRAMMNPPQAPSEPPGA
jgi:ketol-acid reductoisomerase